MKKALAIAALAIVATGAMAQDPEPRPFTAKNPRLVRFVLDFEDNTVQAVVRYEIDGQTAQKVISTNAAAVIATCDQPAVTQAKLVEFKAKCKAMVKAMWDALN